MSVQDEVRALEARFEATNREHAERAELAGRKVDQAMAEAKEKNEKNLANAAKVGARLHEMAGRQKAAGGWGTQAATDKKTGEYAFGTEEDSEQDDMPGFRPGGWAPPSSPVPTPEPVVPVAPVRAAPTLPPPPPPPPPARPARRPQRPVVDDDDDMSNQSWLS
ncbi:hypothetical protein JNUCC0626_37200 [Lentzea sp. JNUCC 0626]|uniref:hypothetical protein n=1 Tax=Lentzea sp. JNUCC 0626 TaxID=3367513 RepID=UPI0037486F84